MKQEKFYQILGIIIIIAFAGSMFGAFLYAPQPSSNNNTSPPTQNKTTYNYSISFDTKVIQELQAIRVAAETSSLNKQEIDLDVQKIEGVARIQFSEFRKQENSWLYFAQIDLKKQASPNEVIERIFDLNYFDAYKEAMKRVSISTPDDAIELYNTDLDITRKFTFEYPTTFTIADLNTMPEDEIRVNGTIQLQGKDVLFLELIEAYNYTQAPDTNTDTIIDMNDFETNTTELIETNDTNDFKVKDTNE
jgi:hypothetical protein